MKALLLVGLGGAFGSICRYLLSTWLMTSGLVTTAAPGRFPLGTFAVNLIGCLLVGVFAGLAQRHAWLDGDLRLLLVVGVLGGFTTFSAFGLDTVHLLRRGDWLIASGYVGGSVLLGIAAVMLGWKLVAPHP